MNYRKLRIAWSVAWSVVAVLLCVLWVRSYRPEKDGDGLGQSTYYQNSRQQLFQIESKSGALHLSSTSPVSSVDGEHMFWRTEDAESQFLGFGWHITPFCRAMRVPIWFMTMSTMLAGVAAPWFRIRFSLRTLLIATTLAAVALGLIVCLR